jgi:hypothetical protein
MKAVKHLGIATAITVGISGSLAFAGTSVVASSMANSLGARRAVALSQVKRKGTKDPIISGNGSQIIPPGSTQYFFAETGELSILGCRAVEINHADGGIFDPNNSGKLVVHGMDVSALILSADADVTQSFFLGAVAPNNALFSGGYAVTSPQSVEFRVSDLPPDSDDIAIIVEGDVTNTDTKPQTVGNLVSGIITLERCF